MSVQTAPGAHMRSEVAEQPELWRSFAESHDEIVRPVVDLLREARSVVFSARGSSAHAAGYAGYLLQRSLPVEISFASPSVYADASHRLFPEGQLLLTMSQSGASPDLLKVAEVARRDGATVVALTNAPDSPLARTADLHVSLDVGPELSVAATKSYTAEVVLMRAVIGRLRGDRAQAVTDEIRRAADVVDGLLQEPADLLDEVAGEITAIDRMLCVGRGISLSSAQEAALKLMETCKLAASGWSAAEVLHGPIGQMTKDTPLFAFGSSGPHDRSVERVIERVLDSGARVIDSASLIRSVAGGGALQEHGRDLVPAAEIVLAQLLALSLSTRRGLDPDRPPGLLKATLTE